MSNDFGGAPGFAVLCDCDGLITQVLCDDFALCARDGGLPHWVSLCDPDSVQKGLALLMRLKEDGTVFEWELNLLLQGEPRPFTIAAASLGDRVVLLGTLALGQEGKLFDGFSRVVNQQINSLRAMSKRVAGEGSQTDHQADALLASRFDSEMFKDMLKLNNRLVNAERELARKNSELRRVASVQRKDLLLLHRALQCTADAVVMAGRDRRIAEVNQAYTAITGIPGPQAIGTTLVLSEPSHHEPGYVESIWKAVATLGQWQGECVSRRRNGELFPNWLSISAVLDDRGRAEHYVVIFSDITRLKDAEGRWQQLAFYDSLTQLPNRVLFKDRLRQAIARARRDNAPLALLFIDLDDFKSVNDSLGHDAGDELLGQAARRIESCVRQSDSIARLGGDEFTVIVDDCRTEADAQLICDKLIRAFAAPFRIGEHGVHIGASIGVSRFPTDGDDPDTLVKNADAAMYAAKSAGRHTSRFFAPSLGERIAQQMHLKAQIAMGLQRNEFQVHLQPEIDLATGRVPTLEALVRWNHPERGHIGPDQFIPIAEESGLIVDLGEFVIREAVRMVKVLRQGSLPQLRVAVNVSRRQLATARLADFIVGELQRQDLPGSALILEVTESLVMADLDRALEVLDSLRAIGVGTAIDDFGTGHSSLHFLRRLPVEFLKIDKSFVADADVSADAAAIVRAITAMASKLGLKTVAEGIETQSQHEAMQQLGCDIGQGYWYARPGPYEGVVEWLAAGRH